MENAPSANAMADLRKKWLEDRDNPLGTDAVGEAWGVLMELGRPTAFATLVALSDGTASIYISTGGGIIGAGSRPAINAAARAVVALAHDALPALTPTSTYPPPSPDEATLYVLTNEGVRGWSGPGASISGQDHPLSALWWACQTLFRDLHRLWQPPT
jgi:hypothetical protein